MNNKTSTHSWLIVSHSAIGRQHVKKNIPCQDAHYLIEVNAETGIAVVCDGAGSAIESHMGAKIVAKQTSVLLKREIETVAWQFPSNTDANIWQNISYEVLLKVRDFLNRFAKKTNRDVKLLACTVIVVVYSPHTILISHIGDGRAAYCNNRGDWQAIMTPFKGEEANQTMFITCDLWCSHAEYLECNIINDDIAAFTLMSDGCENYAFQTNSYDEEKGIFFSLNEPYSKFFQPLTGQLLSLYKQGYSDQELNKEWQNFIESGNESLAKESDDKTLILGILKA
ncbi:MAG: PP2C family serine/threonine-protein phosphatase [Methylovulum sp.]|nr:PP2C family serine/threonine-protein phosphatase [Methylovulum sp.]